MPRYNLSLSPVNSLWYVAKCQIWIGIKHLRKDSSDGKLRFIFLFLTHMAAFTNCMQFYHVEYS